jgi:hypothetical protein
MIAMAKFYKILSKPVSMEWNISHATIQTHIGRIYKKLHVHSRAQAVAKLHQRSGSSARRWMGALSYHAFARHDKK